MIAILLGLVGCGSVPLAEVPIVGGSPEVRDEVIHAVNRFERWVGVGRISLREIRIEDAGPGHLGAYGRISRTIRIDDRPMGRLQREEVVFHELCHALDYQERLVQRRSDLWQALDEAFAARGRSPGPSGVRQRRVDAERFAILCEQGPVWAQLVERECPADDLQPFADLAAWLLDDVWTAEVPTPATLGTPVMWEAPFEPKLLHIRAWPDGHSFGLTVIDRLEPSANTRVERAYLRILDGGPSSRSEVGFYPEPYTRSLPLQLPRWADRSVSSVPYSSYVWSPTSAIVNVDIAGPYLESPIQRTLLLDEDWRATTACSTPAGGTFRGEDEYYLVTAEGPLVIWQALQSHREP
jgi:hypothetical protein